MALAEARERNLFKGVRLSNLGPEISILQYADDALFVGEWSQNNARNLIWVLRCFQLASGFKVNLAKSSVVGIGVINSEVSRMARVLNCKEGSLSLKYLGVPVGGKMTRVVSWIPIMEKFQSKLSSWKSRSLSFGGRLILCKSVLGSLGTYLFSLFKVPSMVISKLESIHNRFF